MIIIFRLFVILTDLFFSPYRVYKFFKRINLIVIGIKQNSTRLINRTAKISYFIYSTADSLILYLQWLLMICSLRIADPLCIIKSRNLFWIVRIILVYFLNIELFFLLQGVTKVQTPRQKFIFSGNNIFSNILLNLKY